MAHESIFDAGQCGQMQFVLFVLVENNLRTHRLRIMVFGVADRRRIVFCGRRVKIMNGNASFGCLVSAAASTLCVSVNGFCCIRVRVSRILLIMLCYCYVMLKMTGVCGGKGGGGNWRICEPRSTSVR